MKILELTDTISIYDINTSAKFDLVADDLMRTVKIMQDHKVMNDMPIGEYINILRKQIETKYPKFKLLVAIDTEMKRVVGFVAAFIAVNDNQKNICLLYGAYFFPNLLKKILPEMLMYLDIWCKPYDCQKTMFETSRSPKAYTRLLKSMKFKPTHTRFERDIGDLL